MSQQSSLTQSAHSVRQVLTAYNNTDKTLVPLEGEEIGKLVAQAVQNGVVEKQPWYAPTEMLSRKPIVDGKMDIDFDSVVVDAPIGRSSAETTLMPASNRSPD